MMSADPIILVTKLVYVKNTVEVHPTHSVFFMPPSHYFQAFKPKLQHSGALHLVSHHNLRCGPRWNKDGMNTYSYPFSYSLALHTFQF
jgi:hypothetical protein